MAVVISSGWVSHSRVEPSTSSNSNVTIPVVNSPRTLSSLQSTSGASARRSISLMLASMREAHTAKHQCKRVYTTPDRADLRVLTDGLVLATSDSRLVEPEEATMTVNTVGTNI